MEPVRSRCLCVRVGAPTNDGVMDVMAEVARKEGLVLPPAFAGRVCQYSNRNLRRWGGGEAGGEGEGEGEAAGEGKGEGKGEGAHNVAGV